MSVNTSSRLVRSFAVVLAILAGTLLGGCITAPESDETDDEDYAAELETASLPIAGDSDGDGFASTAAGGLDCNDSNPAIHPGAADPVGDGIDSNCDGVDGVRTAGASNSGSGDSIQGLCTTLICSKP